MYTILNMLIIQINVSVFGTWFHEFLASVLCTACLHTTCQVHKTKPANMVGFFLFRDSSGSVKYSLQLHTIAHMSGFQRAIVNCVTYSLWPHTQEWNHMHIKWKVHLQTFKIPRSNNLHLIKKICIYISVAHNQFLWFHAYFSSN